MPKPKHVLLKLALDNAMWASAIKPAKGNLPVVARTSTVHTSASHNVIQRVSPDLTYKKA